LRTSEIHAKLIDRLKAKRNEFVEHALVGIETGQDASYILGNRIGKRAGMEFMIQQVVDFFTKEENQDEKL
jgi:hypothetical protein